MSGLFGRVAQYLMNEVVVKQLANSRIFQSFAMRTHKGVESIKKGAVSSQEQMQNNAKNATSSLAQFSKALKEEVSKDLNRFNKK